MRLRLAIAAFLLPAPFCLAAQTSSPSQAELSVADVQTYGEWMAMALAVDAEGQNAFVEIMPRINAISQTVRDRASARAASVELAALVAGALPKLSKSQDALRALPPLPEPLDSRYPFPTKQLKADLLATGQRIMTVLDATVGLANAMAADDQAAAARHADAVKRGATLLVDGQITLVRARRASSPVSESTHQAMGLMETLYRGMSLMMKQRFESGPWPRARFLELAEQAEDLTAQGRSNLERELKLARAARPTSSEDRKTAALDLETLTIENETFVQGDALAALFKSLADSDRQSSKSSISQLTAIESQLVDITGKQARAMSAR